MANSINQMQQERLLKFSGTYNFRDMGGYKTSDGRTMRRGLLFRSDELSRLSKQDLIKLQKLNLKNVCDLRAPNERRSKPDRIPAETTIHVFNIPMYPSHRDPNRWQRLLWFVSGKFKKFDFEKFMMDYYHKIVFDHAVQIGEIFTLVSNKNNLPALFHCAGGKDRTGIISALIQLLVGIPRETVMDDYLLTNQFLEPTLKKYIRYFRFMSLYRIKTAQILPLLEARREYLEETMDEILNKYGSFEEYIVKDCGCSPTLVSELKKILLD